MIAKTGFKMGNVTYQFEIDEKDEMESLSRAITLGNPPRVCNICDNGDSSLMSLTSNKDKEGNIYVKVRCQCRAEAKLGQYKAGGFFWHEFKVYAKDTQGEI